MPTLPEAIRRFAEEPEASMPDPAAPSKLIRRPSFTLGLSPSPSLSFVSGIRTTEGALDKTIAAVRRLVEDAGYTRSIWVLGPSCRPHGLSALLAERGFIPATRSPTEPVATAMALIEPPPPPPVGIEARRARTLDEYLQAIRIVVEAFGQSEQEASAWLAAAPVLWTHQNGETQFTHVALVDGRIVGFGFAIAGSAGLFLGGGGVLPHARGRGAYRALVAVRWTEAVRLGKPALVIHAGAMSSPIASRCGFKTVCAINRMDDDAIGRTNIDRTDI